MGSSSVQSDRGKCNMLSEYECQHVDCLGSGLVTKRDPGAPSPPSSPFSFTPVPLRNPGNPFPSDIPQDDAAQAGIISLAWAYVNFSVVFWYFDGPVTE